MNLYHIRKFPFGSWCSTDNWNGRNFLCNVIDHLITYSTVGWSNNFQIFYTFSIKFGRKNRGIWIHRRNYTKQSDNLSLDVEYIYNKITILRWWSFNNYRKSKKHFLGRRRTNNEWTQMLVAVPFKLVVGKCSGIKYQEWHPLQLRNCFPATLPPIIKWVVSNVDLSNWRLTNVQTHKTIGVTRIDVRQSCGYSGQKKFDWRIKTLVMLLPISVGPWSDHQSDWKQIKRTVRWSELRRL